MPTQVMVSAAAEPQGAKMVLLAPQMTLDYILLSVIHQLTFN
jgi:hypothetical protein